MNETSFKTKVLIGAVLAILFFVYLLSQGEYPDSVFVFAYCIVLTFCTPWGWSLPNKFVAKGNTDYVIPFPLYISIKVVCAIVLGWAGFLYDLYKMFIKK